MTAIIISEHHLERYANYKAKENIPHALLVPTVQGRMPNELWIILNVFKNKPLVVTIKQTNRYVDQFQQETTKKTKHCKGVLWSRENGKTTFIDTTNMILVLALSKDYHINVSYEDKSCSVHDRKLQLCNEVSKLNLSTLTFNNSTWYSNCNISHKT